MRSPAQSVAAVTSTAQRSAQQARRTAGRLLATSIGFSAAYYLDPENGAARRTRLRATARQAAHTLHEVRGQDGVPVRAGSVDAPRKVPAPLR